MVSTVWQSRSIRLCCYRVPVDHLVVISGCSGGGKSTLLAELAQRGYGVVEEPGRRIVREELDAHSPNTPASRPSIRRLATR
jgi:predicted ATPase